MSVNPKDILAPADYAEYLTYKPALLHALESAGTQAMMAAHPALRLYRQMEKRLDLLSKIEEYLLSQQREYDKLPAVAKLADKAEENYCAYLRSYMPDAFVRAPASSYNTLVSSLGPNPFNPVVARLLGDLAIEKSYVAGLFTQLDIYNTTDHTPISEGVEIRPLWDEYIKDFPEKSIRLHYGFTKIKAKEDEASHFLREMGLKSRGALHAQKLELALHHYHDKGWYFVFDTLTLRDEDMAKFHSEPHAIRDHMRTIGRLVNEAEGRSKRESYKDCFKYFCVPEYGTLKGRLHFHVVYMMRTLPLGQFDPNSGRRFPTKRQLDTLRVWKYGFTTPIAIRYQADAYSKLGWHWPVDTKTKKNIPSKPLLAVVRYVTKYCTKQTASRVELLRINQEDFTSCQRIKSSKLNRVQMSQGLMELLPPVLGLPTPVLQELIPLSGAQVKMKQILKRNAKRECARRLGTAPLWAILDTLPKTENLLIQLRASIQASGTFNPQSFIDSIPMSTTLTDISDKARTFLDFTGLIRCVDRNSSVTVHGSC